MGSFTKEPAESAKTAQDPASHGELAPQGMPTASFDAFGIEIPVQLHGGRAGTGGQSATDTYIEDTCTLIVFPQGAVLRSSTHLAAGQHLLLKNRQTNQEVACRVANLRSYCTGYVEIEFIRPTPGFWGISFPSEASKSSGERVASPAATPPKQAATLAPVSSATRISKTNTLLPGSASSKDNLQGSSGAKVSQRAIVPAAPPTAVKGPPKVEQPVVPAAIVPAASPLGKANIPLARKLEMPGTVPPSAPVTPASSSPISSLSPAAAPPRPQESLSVTDLVVLRPPVESVPARNDRAAASTALPSSLGSFDEKESWASSSHGASYVKSYGKSSSPRILGAEEGRGDGWGLGVKLPANEHRVRGKLILVSAIAVLVTALGTGAFLFRRHSLNTAAVAARPVTTQALEQPNPAAQPQIATSPAAEALQAPVQEPVQAPSSQPSNQPNNQLSNSPSSQLNNSPSNQPSDPLPRKQMPPTIAEGIAAQPKTKAPVAAQPAPAAKASFKLAPSGAAPKRAAASRETPQLPVLGEEVGSSPNGENNTANGIMTDALRGDALVPPPPVKIQENVGGDVKLPRLQHMVPPSYPASAKQINLQGEVTVQATIDAAGKVTDAKVVSGPPLLQEAAIDAVRRWKYEAATLDGKPVPMQVIVKVRFRLN